MRKFCPVYVWVVLFSLIFVQASKASPCPFADCELQVIPSKKIYACLKYEIDSPAHFIASQWIVYSPYPPVLTGQKETAARLTAQGLPAQANFVRELSPLHRAVMQLSTPAPADAHSNLSVVGEYWATLYSRKLVKRTNAGAKRSEFVLSPEEKKQLLRESETLNFNSSEFQTWLERYQLRRQAGESDMDFAWRTFETIRALYEYHWESQMDRHLSVLCKRTGTDCGGLSYLFVGTLRANGVPARALIGRWAQSSDRVEDGSTYGKCHVKSEFFAPGIGFVPVEMSQAVSNKYRNASAYFGNDDGCFLTFHEDPDLIFDSLAFGPKNIRSVQDIVYWVVGLGNFQKPRRHLTWEVVTEMLKN